MIGDSWRSSANQSMLIWELTPYKARFGAQKHHSELIFEPSKQIPKATQKSKGKDEEDIVLHGAINEEEAKCYSLNLEKIVSELGTNIQDEVPDAMKGAIQSYKEAIAVMVPGMDVADPNIVWKQSKTAYPYAPTPMKRNSC